MQEPADFWAQQGLIESNGASMLTKDTSGKAQATFASKEGVEAFQLYADMVKDESALHISWEEGKPELYRRQCGNDVHHYCKTCSCTKSAQFDVATVKSPDLGRQGTKSSGRWMFPGKLLHRVMNRFRRHGSLRNICTTLNLWQHGPLVPVMCRPEKMLQMRKTDWKSFLAENEMMKAAIEQMDGVVSWTSFPGDAGLQAEQLLLDMRGSDLRWSGKRGRWTEKYTGSD